MEQLWIGGDDPALEGDRPPFTFRKFNADHARSGETPYIAVGAGIHIVLTAFLA
jgi:hypothetical protein